MKFPIITAILCLLICACGKQDKEPEISLYVGLDQKGRLYVEDQESMETIEMNLRSKGSVENSEVATCKAQFSRISEEKEVELDLSATSEAENVYVVKGSYVAKVPFRLTPRGPGEEIKDDLGQTYEAGSGEIEIRLEYP